MAERSRIVTAGSRVRLRLASDEWLVASVRRGDMAAFETLYERHSGELLAFCIYMLGSRQDAEDAVQATFASAYRSMRADKRPIALRPWLFTIARNDCLSILRRRRPAVELTGDVAVREDFAERLETREELRHVFRGLRELPERQRAALILAEVHGLSQTEIGEVLGVRSEQVKAYVYQARSTLISEKRAREADCRDIREELSSARGAALLKGRLRRHLRACPECRTYADGIARQRRQLSALLPVVPATMMLRSRAIEGALGIGATDPATYAGGAAVGAGVAVEFAGGGVNALLAKVAAGVAALGASAGVGVSVLAGSPSPVGGSGGGGTTQAVLSSHSSPAATAGSSGATITASGRSLQVGGEDVARKGGRPHPGPVGADTTALELQGAQQGSQHILTTTGRAPAHDGGSVGSSGGSGGANTSGGGGGRSAEEKAAASGERQRLREERKQATEAKRREREARGPKTGSGIPRSEEERLEKREERRKAHSEREPEVGSGIPPTEEERREKREEIRRKREAREAAEEPTG